MGGKGEERGGDGQEPAGVPRPRGDAAPKEDLRLKPGVMACII